MSHVSSLAGSLCRTVPLSSPHLYFTLLSSPLFPSISLSSLSLYFSLLSFPLFLSPLFPSISLSSLSLYFPLLIPLSSLLSHHSDNLAKKFVEMKKEPVDNYKTIINDFIEKHERGKPSTANMGGVLFYLRDGHLNFTCGDLLEAVKSTCYQHSSNIDSILRY